MRHWFPLLTLLLFVSPLRGQQQKYSSHYYERINQFEQEPALTSNSIVMLGNSLTEFGGNWSERLGIPHVINRGIIGDEIYGIYDRLYQILPYHPRKIFLLIGINDVSHNLPTDSIIHRIETVIKHIQKESPQTKLYVQSLLPINETFNRYRLLIGKTDMIPCINKKLKRMAKSKHVRYISLYPLFKEKSSNRLRKELTTDGLHLNESGYAIWTKELKKILK